eukprot:CAMPEP_0170551194 /NCGR_PEP_ID=MMETSP0211-20121228/9218_1 /TAXON_ID=311385 /ORGANISM="Pseudokeronopsis sp., Strain OXSARD2" /LENGTH=85 /DNA_ID=CAMNT_0010858213 /DNA_START=2511 /DNA_END=2768 /DNA_ORIENTATION=+
MKVKKHLLKKDHTGKLVDAETDSDDNSPEAEFCRVFTKNYDVIGQKFPELLRLKEMLKLSAVYVQLDAILKNFIARKQELKPDVA